MPKLYTKEYKRIYEGSHFVASCREGMLRGNFDNIVSNIKYLTRSGIKTSLLHSIPNRYSNRKIFLELERKLPDTQIKRVPIESNVNYYDYAMDYAEEIAADKLIFVENTFLRDERGQRIGSMTTDKLRRKQEKGTPGRYSDSIDNPNLQEIFERICAFLEENQLSRIHIIPNVKNAIRHEVFSVEGVGTLIANNFKQILSRAETGEVDKIERILRPYFKHGLLKSRNKEYIQDHMDQFFFSKIDDIPVGCMQLIPVDERTLELGAFAVTVRFRGQDVGFFLLQEAENLVRSEQRSRLISLTNNRKLQEMYTKNDFTKGTPKDLIQRQDKSPLVSMFYKSIA